MADANFASGTVWTGDCLNVLRGMNSGCVDLIYADPPFNSNRDYAAPVGSKAAGAAFKDTWTLDDVDVHEHGELADRNPAAYAVIQAARQAHGKGMQSYLIMMAARLLEMRRVLKDDGSIYVHCDPTASHYLKLLMDAIFGAASFRSDISWKRSSAHSDTKQGRRQHGRIHDVLLFYVHGGYTWNPLYTDYDPDYVRTSYRHVEPGTGRRYRLDNLTGPGGAAKGNPAYEVMGVTRYWRYSEKRMAALIAEGRVVQTRDGGVPAYKRYLDEMPGVPLQDLWADLPPIGSRAKERLGYPTLKPLALLERIIKASSNAGDLVLDPFCGCATALVAADRLGRQWAGIDLSPLAIRLVNERIAADRGPLRGSATALTEPPMRTDLGDVPNYRTHRHRLYGEQEGVCVGCDIHFLFPVMDVDHILPRSQGGTDHASNLQLLCSGCNRRKGGRTMAEWRAAQ